MIAEFYEHLSEAIEKLSEHLCREDAVHENQGFCSTITSSQAGYTSHDTLSGNCA